MDWIKARLSEPSSHACLAAACGFIGAYWDSRTLEPSGEAQVLMLLAAIFALIGLARKG